MVERLIVLAEEREAFIARDLRQDRPAASLQLVPLGPAAAPIPRERRGKAQSEDKEQDGDQRRHSVSHQGYRNAGPMASSPIVAVNL